LFPQNSRPLNVEKILGKPWLGGEESKTPTGSIKIRRIIPKSSARHLKDNPKKI